MKLFFAAIITICTTTAFAVPNEISLPDIGASADRLMSPEQQRRYGESVLREFRRLDLVLEDSLVADYVRGLGYRLVAQSERQANDFTFFVVQSDEVNAFALPGGYIGTNAGLLYMAENESELAAVLSHEIAHVSQNHLVRQWESMQKVTLPIALAMIGAILATQGTSGDGTEAALVSGIGLLQQKSINFTRNNEYEADRIGIQTLHRAGLNAGAMADFFARMGRALRANGQEMPEFLRTHPVTTSRISEAKNRAETMRSHSLPINAGDPSDDRRFLLIRERAHVLSATNPAELIQNYQGQLKHADKKRAESLHYGLSLAQLRVHRPHEARKILESLAEANPNNILFELPLAQAESDSGEVAAALSRLEKLNRSFPGNRSVLLGYAAELAKTGNPANGTKAVGILRDLVVRFSDDPSVQQAFARASEVSGQELRALEAHAEVALLTGQPLDAMEQLHRLLKHPKLDYYRRARVEARIEAITPWVLEAERERDQNPTSTIGN